MPNSDRPDLDDIIKGNWVDRAVPTIARPFFRLARVDRPLPILLVLFPCWTAMVQAAQGAPSVKDFIVFTLGAIIMRGAGCTINDIADRSYDGLVERTRSRPLVTGQITYNAALVFVVLQLLAAAALLVFLTSKSQLLALSLVPLAIVYPFCKRFTNWPQIILGAAFNWGMLMSWSQLAGYIPVGAVLMWLGAVAWQVGYDTIYAYVDAEDDARLGLKSTALLFGKSGKVAIGLCYSIALFFWAVGGMLVGMSGLYVAGLVLVAGHFIYQIYRIDLDMRHANYRLFLENVLCGALLMFATIFGVA